MPLRSPAFVYALLGVLALQRLYELRLSRNNLRSLEGERLAADSGSNWVLMVSVHALWILGTAAEVAWRGAVAPAPVFWGALALLVPAQAFRIWCIRSLGPLWNARGVVLRGAAVVEHGPYRWMRHPNYLAVVLELVLLPAAAGAWITLIVVNALNAVALSRRIRGENALLRGLSGYEERMGKKGGILPRLRAPREARSPHASGR